MKPVVTVTEMRAIDDEARAVVSLDTLIERAATALSTHALRMLGGGYGRRAVAICGKGNNGEDGRVCAERLRQRGAKVEVIEAADVPDRIGEAGTIDLVIDAAYGTGFHGTYRAPSVPAGVKVIAADIPSGVNGDTGEACGEALRADVTVTFGALKPGLFQGDGAKLCGRIEVADIGLDVSRARLWVIEDGDVGRLLPARPKNAHKWLSAVAVVAGSPGMTGAADLCARAAYRAGAGMVRLGIPGALPTELPVSEAVTRTLAADDWVPDALEMADRCKVLVIGPGLGRSESTTACVRALVARCPVPVVIDADGLFALGSGADLAAALGGNRSAGAAAPVRVLTPHDGEFARLAGGPPDADRIASVRRLASESGAVVLLKGSVTMVAGPDGNALVSTAGSPRLATAGTGDVLSGVIAAFVARGVAPLEAAALGAHVHGAAAALGPSEGLVAGDVVDLVATWLSTVRRG